MNIILWILFALVGTYIIRTLKGPSAWDRLLGINLVTTKTIIIIMVFASIQNTTFLLDFAIIYALGGFISTIFITMLLASRSRNRAKLEKRPIRRQDI